MKLVLLLLLVFLLIGLYFFNRRSEAQTNTIQQPVNNQSIPQIKEQKVVTNKKPIKSSLKQKRQKKHEKKVHFTEESQDEVESEESQDRVESEESYESANVTEQSDDTERSDNTESNHSINSLVYNLSDCQDDESKMSFPDMK